MTSAATACDDGPMWRVPLSRAQLNDAALTLLFFGLGLCIYLAGFAAVGDGTGAVLPPWSALVTLGLACCCQLFRSTRPDLALAGTTIVLVADTALAPSIPVWLVLSDVVYAVCVYGSGRLVRILYGICALIALATLLLIAAEPHSLDWRFVFIGVLWLLAVIASPLAYGLAVREHRNALSLERVHTKVLAELAEHERAEAISAERQRLARELHDVIAGRLSAIAVHSAAALQYPDNSALAHKALQAVRTSSVEALDEMRGLIDLLAAQPPSIEAGTDPHPDRGAHTTAGLRRIDRLTTPIIESGTSLVLDCPDWITDAQSVDAIPPVTDIAAYRIIAESLANATVHAPNQPIWVSISHGCAALTIQIRNALPPTPPRAHHASPTRLTADPLGSAHIGRGISNMTTRADAVGGTLSAGEVGNHFVVTAHLPAALRDHPTSAATQGDSAQ